MNTIIILDQDIPRLTFYMRNHPERDLNNFRLLDSLPGPLCSNHQVIGYFNGLSPVGRWDPLW